MFLFQESLVNQEIVFSLLTWSISMLCVLHRQWNFSGHFFVASSCAPQVGVKPRTTVKKSTGRRQSEKGLLWSWVALVTEQLTMELYPKLYPTVCTFCYKKVDLEYFLILPFWSLWRTESILESSQQRNILCVEGVLWGGKAVLEEIGCFVHCAEA